MTEIGDGKPEVLGIGSVNREMGRLSFMIETGDARPSALLQASADQACRDLTSRLAQWHDLNQQKLPPVNEILQKQNLPPLPIAATIPVAPQCRK